MCVCDDPDHKAKFKVNEEVGSLNYCIYIRQMEMEISNDLLQRLDSHLNLGAKKQDVK